MVLLLNSTKNNYCLFPLYISLTNLPKYWHFSYICIRNAFGTCAPLANLFSVVSLTREKPRILTSPSPGFSHFKSPVLIQYL